MILVESIPVEIYAGQSDYKTAHMLHNQDCNAAKKMEVSVPVPRLNASIPLTVVNIAILGAFVRLGYRNPTGDQEEAISEFLKGCDVFISLPIGGDKSRVTLVSRSLSTAFGVQSWDWDSYTYFHLLRRAWS